MTSPATPAEKPARRRWYKRFWPIFWLVLTALLVSAVLYISSDSFTRRLQAQLIAGLERATGDKAEIGSLTWKFFWLQFEIRDLSIGHPDTPEKPYVHVDRVLGGMKMRSLLTGNIRLRDLTVEHPVVHLRIGENGAATLPTPKTAQPMVFTVDRMQITNGELRLNESRLPFDFSGDSLSLKLAYHSGTKTYEVHGDIAKLSLRYGNARSPEGSLSLDALLRSNDLDIKALSMTMQKSSLQATGKITNFAHPEAHFRYRASVDIKAVAASAGVPPMKSGRLDLSGNLDYLDGKYSSTGDAALRAFEWHDTFVHVTGVEATSPFKVVPGNVSLPKVTARLLGGSAQGNIVIADAIPLHGKQKATPQRGTANFTIANLLVSDVAKAISNARMPLDRINAEGAVSGEIKTSWVGSPRNAVSRVTVQVTAPQNPAVEQVPVSGQLDAVFNGGTQTIDVAKLVLSTRAIHVQASGTLGSKTAQAQISVSAEGLRELQPALAALSPETRLPIKVDGQASFNGAIFGQLEWPSLRGHLELRDFDSILEPPAKGSKPNLLTALASSSRQGLQRIHWDSLSGNLTYTPSGVAIQDGVLKRGTAEAHLTATAGLREGLLQSTSQVAFNMQVRNVTLEDAQKLTGTQYPLSGLLNANLHAAGTPTNLRGGGTVDVSKLAIAGEPFRSFRSDLNFAGQELQLNNLVLAHNGAQLSGRAAYNPVAQSFSFDLRATRVELSDFGRFAPVRITIAGNADFHVTGSGTVDAPLLDGQLQVPDLVLNGEHSGSLRASAKSQGRDLLIQAQTRLENAIMDIDGAVKMTGDFPGKLTINFDRLDFDPLLRGYVRGRVTGHSSVSGSMVVSGPMARPRDLTISGNLSQLAAEIETVKMQNDGPVRFSAANEVLRIDQMRLIGEGTDLSAGGTLLLAPPRTLDLHSQGRVNLKLFQTLDPAYQAYGLAAFTLNVGGTLSDPLATGRLQISDAGISFVDLPNGLSKINGTLVFAQDRVQIEKLTAQTGGGELNLSGFLVFRNGMYFDVTAKGKDVRLRYPPGISSSADANLHYAGSARSSLLSGDIIVNRFAVTPQFDFAQYLINTTKPQGVGVVNPFLDNLRLDVHVTTIPELEIESSMAKISGDADLHIRGTATRPSLLGRVNFADGDIFFNGTKYHLERGDVSFSNPLKIDPVINAEMSARVRNYDITLGFHGSLVRGLSPPTYRSDPPLSSSDIIALLAFGRTRSEDIYLGKQPGQADVNSASNVILGEALNETLSNRAQRLFGVGRVKIDPQVAGSGSANSPSARVTLEQPINNNITFTYITNLTQSAQTVVQVEYNLNPNVSIVAVRDQNGIVGLDVRIRRRKK